LITVTNRNHLPYEGQAEVETDPMPVPASDAEPELGLALAGPQPNPTAGATRIRFTVPSSTASGSLDLAIYNCQGQRVRTLVNEQLPAGSHQRLWNGRDDRGHTVPSGIYFAELRAASTSAGGAGLRQRLILLR
jgi:hypothetical protein